MWIVSNAVSDIMNSFTVLIVNVLSAYHYHFNYNLLVCWMVYIGAVSFFTFLGVNVDRAFAIKMPMKTYSQSKKKFWISIILCWVAALIPSIPYLFDTTMAECAKHCSACWYPVDNVSGIHSNTLLIHST